MRHVAKLAVAAVLAVSPLAGCGSNEAARGIPSAAQENASPESKKELRMTEQQRDAQAEQQEQQRDIQNFDAAQQQEQKEEAKAPAQ
jgi:outer membrane murein-binding lipoprotein Lpp